MADSRLINKLAEKYERARGTIKRMRDEGEGVVGRTMEALSIQGGAAATGFINGVFGFIAPTSAAQYPVAFIPGTQIEAAPAVGAALQLAAIANLFGKNSGFANNFAGGMLAPKTAEVVAKQVVALRLSHR